MGALDVIVLVCFCKKVEHMLRFVLQIRNQGLSRLVSTSVQFRIVLKKTYILSCRCRTSSHRFRRNVFPLSRLVIFGNRVMQFLLPKHARGGPSQKMESSYFVSMDLMSPWCFLQIPEPPSNCFCLSGQYLIAKPQ